MATSFSHELTEGDRFTLRECSEDSDSQWPPDAIERYSFYRRHRHGKAASIAYAIAWARNTTEQAVRRRPLDLRSPAVVE